MGLCESETCSIYSSNHVKMVTSRTVNSLKNTGISLSVQIVCILLSFIGRTVFIKQLNIEYLGVNGLFSNILTLLSLAELGIGTAITYMMYKPIADNDTEKIAALNNLYRQVYNCIGLFIVLVGLSLTPFITCFIKEVPNIEENIHIIYVLYVLNTSMSYFFTYKRSLLIAYQKEYVNNKNVLQFTLLKEVSLVFILFTVRSYYMYLVAQVIVTFLSNIAISYKTNRLFPEVVNLKPAKVPRNEIKVIMKNTMAMVCHRIGSVMVSGTGNMFISYYVGIAMVGIYSNYVLISTSACMIVAKAVNSITASFGNLVATADDDKVYSVFRKIYFMNFTLAYVIAIFFFALVNPFIAVWIGSEYYLDKISVLLIAVNSIFFNQLRIPSQMAINTYGLFWQIKWKSIIEALINLAMSFLFTAYLGLGIKGILLSMLLSNIATNLWWEPYVVFKYGFKMPLVIYMKEFAKSTLMIVCTIMIISFATSLIDSVCPDVFINFILRLLMTIIVPCSLLYLCYSGSEEFSYTFSLLRKLSITK